MFRQGADATLHDAAVDLGVCHALLDRGVVGLGIARKK